MLLDASKSSLLLIDIQDRLLPAMAEPERRVAKADILLKAVTELADPRVTYWELAKWGQNSVHGIHPVICF